MRFAVIRAREEFHMNRTRTYKIAVFAALLLWVITQSAESTDSGFETRPIPLGTSGGNIKDITRSFCCGGTLGSLVQDGSGVQYILSNNHVLARVNRGLRRESIIQPGLIDQDPGCLKDAGDTVASLSDFVPLSFRRNTINRVDAAIAQVQAGQVDPSGSVLNIGELSNATAVPVIGMAVKKNGRTSGLTAGTVTALDVTVDIEYDRQCGITFLPRVARFTGQIIIEPASFSAAGDSGSLIVEDCSPHPRPIGLLFAGSDSNTLANPIGEVLSGLGVSMVGTSDSCSTQATGLHMAAPTPLASPLDMGNAIRVKRLHEVDILKRPGVVGMGVGLSDTEPGRTVIEVYVKKPSHAMKPTIPETMEDIPIKIVETGVFRAY
jgi:hypothetical protein